MPLYVPIVRRTLQEQSQSQRFPQQFQQGAAKVRAAITQTSGCNVHVKIWPRPRNLSESTEVLRVLQRYGEVVTFKHLKYEPNVRAQNSALAIFKSADAAQELLRASPIRFTFGQLLNHDGVEELGRSGGIVATTNDGDDSDPLASFQLGTEGVQDSEGDVASAGSQSLESDSDSGTDGVPANASASLDNDTHKPGDGPIKLTWPPMTIDRPRTRARPSPSPSSPASPSSTNEEDLSASTTTTTSSRDPAYDDIDADTDPAPNPEPDVDADHNREYDDPDDDDDDASTTTSLALPAHRSCTLVIKPSALDHRAYIARQPYYADFRIEPPAYPGTALLGALPPGMRGLANFDLGKGERELRIRRRRARDRTRERTADGGGGADDHVDTVGRDDRDDREDRDDHVDNVDNVDRIADDEEFGESGTASGSRNSGRGVNDDSGWGFEGLTLQELWQRGEDRRASDRRRREEGGDSV